MELTGRQGAILGVLLEEGRETTLGRIAEALGVSARTVHRELARLAAPLRARFGISLSSRAGHGLALVGSPEALAACRAELERSAPRALDGEERSRALALILLDSSEAVKLYALALELKASTALVRRDLETLRPWLALHGLSLTLRKGLGVRVEGGESSRRQAIASLAMEQLGEAGILSMLGGTVRDGACPDGPLARLLGACPAASLRAAERALSGLPKGTLPALAPRDYLALVVHLAVALARDSKGARLEPSDARPSDAGGTTQTEFDAASIARHCVSALPALAGSPAAEAEVAAAERFLRGAKIERPDAGLLDAGLGSVAEASALATECGRLLGRDFDGDRVLRDGLAAHWGPAAYRLRNGLPIRNPLLERIRGEYPEVFAAVRTACAVAFPGLPVGDDEVGYLALHFGAAVARAEGGERRFRALVVCSAGIGSARMLASRIRAELPEIDIVANLSWFDVREVPHDDWDLIVSTIPLPLDRGDYALVDPLLSPEGLRELRARLASRRGRALTHASGPARGPSGREGTLDSLQRLSRHLSALIGLLERLRVFRDARADDDWDGFLSLAVGRCASAGLVADGESALLALRERSRDRGILLPSSRVLFLHARGQGIEVPSFTVHAFEGPVPAWSDAWEARPTRLALLLAPRSLSSETQDILNEISVSLLDARTVELIHDADEADLRSYYSRYLERYFRSMPPQGD
ncbi:MAG: transcription antiterminator [Spirochaetales bacterium]|nr:transcription antiterminator [Spirochaetales bacterium]